MLSYPSGLPPVISSCRSGKAQAAGSSIDEVHPRQRHWRRYREWDRISCTRWGVTASTACCSKHGAHEAGIVGRTQTNLDVDELGAPPPKQCFNKCMGSWYCEYARGELGGELCRPCHRCACEPLLSACPWGAGLVCASRERGCFWADALSNASTPSRYYVLDRMFVSPDDAGGATASRIEKRDRLISNGENGVFVKLPTHRSLPARSKPCRSSLSSASHAASRSTLLGGVSAGTSATACSATLPIFTKKDTCKNLRIYFNISNIFKDSRSKYFWIVFWNKRNTQNRKKSVLSVLATSLAKV